MVELNQQINWMPGARQGRLVRQVAGQRPGLVDQPQPVLGLADPGVEVGRPGVPAGGRLRLAGRAGARLRGEGRPTCTGPAIDELTRPNPDDPTGRSTMRRVPEVLDCWFESGSMPFAQVHYPFENRGVVRAPLPGRLHRRVHRPDPRLVLHDARAGHRAVRPAGVPQLRQPRHPARLRRPQDVQEPAQLPGRLRGVRHLRLGRDAVDADVLAGAARRRHVGHRDRRSGTPCGR